MSAITERRDVGMYIRCLCLCLCWVFRIGNYVSQLPLLCIMLLLRAVLKHGREECCKSKKAYVF